MDLLLQLVGDNALFDWLGEILQSEVTKMTIAFMLAARLHRRWVKQDIAQLTAAINNVADKLTLDLNSHSKRIDDISVRLTTVEKGLK